MFSTADSYLLYIYSYLFLFVITNNLTIFAKNHSSLAKRTIGTRNEKCV